MLQKLLNLKLQHKIAILILLLAIIWMVIGGLKKDNHPQNDTAVNTSNDNLTNVKVVESHAQEKIVYLPLMGEIEAFRSVNIMPEVDGRVLDVLVKDGDYVQKGDILIRVEKYEKLEQLKQAQALLRQRELEYKASQSLNESGYRSEINDALSFAALESARADAKKAEINLDNTDIKTPFSGFIDKINVQVGSLVSHSAGLPIVQVVDFAKIKIITYVPEKYVEKLKVGDICNVSIAEGKVIKVPIVFISKVINRNTRTYRVEMLWDNNDTKILNQGAMYSVKVPIGKYQAHKISASALGLQNNGDLGIKVIVNDKVKFIPVEVIDTEYNGDVWVSNIPKTVNLITLGHEYVTDNASIKRVS
ncbi:efflux RND transporter periplasmic adaptor subunit [Ehrlichia ruminantium]|uniref:Efflux RND transporter periplasmic adaptor subunit n=1 Tax=Ehrlichia ruminantium TaxID=779 RepID=A0AAE6Q940_EHRRU|nr:efflux RND transporter periplasmic adaptor subunit [Ehrlichia ruminantium]QGR02577.1 efflux RND transporter periplasmic adaptor subunit [Ehrlichia ruminantium]QGR03497.1 efflux RND transporter periplasmic adaptor subunit [Ehrlichia ruminantium]QGR04423.1 efflux RND transporter periplasmic adaptor subunit [Ehrlichia ruminantium]